VTRVHPRFPEKGSPVDQAQQRKTESLLAEKRTMTYRLYELPRFPNAGGRKTETVEERSPLHNIRQPGSVDRPLARIHHSQNITHGSD
ncbi:MAG TPA: hypothetical protein VLJ20_07630, partial [Acetobacteraceae bacterium]|nr:hypothetical protein [Acetobacteraceae bacterium]